MKETVDAITDEKKKARAAINLYKMTKIFGFYSESTDIKEIVKELTDAYFRMKDLDGKPEKGERKIADDIVLILNEILSEFTTSSDLDHWALYRLSLLEFALERSPYNFDISMALLKLYD